MWAFFFALGLTSSFEEQRALFYARLGEAVAPFIPVMWFHFCCIYAGSQANQYRKILTGYGLATSCVFISFHPEYVAGTKPMVDIEYYPQAGSLFSLYVGLYLIGVALGFWELLKYLKSQYGKERVRTIGFIVSTGIAYIGGTGSFLPMYGFEWKQYGMLGMPLYPFIMAYLLMRQKLFSESELAYAAHRDKLAAIGTIAASVNHEIKNPLFVIRGLADSFIENKKSALFKTPDEALVHAEEAMQKTGEQVQRALEIMKNFSGFAKQSLDDMPDLKPVMMQDVISRILPLVAYELKLDHISIHADVPEDFPPVQADLRYLEEILFNLIMNSCQALKAHGGKIEIAAAESEKAVVVSVSDNGPGIPKELQKQIFEPFYTTKEEGTGLGLYVTRQLVEKLGGVIAIASNAGQGTLFRLEFKKA